LIARIRFSKLGKIRWTSQRDVARLWERALRRAGLPISYSGGFSPRPRLSFGLALPTGCESTAEYLDVFLDRELELGELSLRVAAALPAGIEVMATGSPEVGRGSLQEEVTSCTWEVDVAGGARDLEAAVSGVMDAQSLPVERERKGRRVCDDLRPSLLELFVQSGEEQVGNGRARLADEPLGLRLSAELATRPRGVRPAELALAMGVCFGVVRRTHQWIERDGSKFEPLQARAALCAGAEARAS